MNQGLAMTDCTLIRRCSAIFVLISILSSAAYGAEGDEKPFKPQQLHGEVFGLEATKAAACGRLLVLGSAKERVEEFGEARRNSPKVAEFFGLSTWTMQTVDKPKPQPAFTVSPDVGFVLPRERRLVVIPVNPVSPDAGLGRREPTPERIRKEIGTISSGPYAGRAEITVTRTNGTSVIAEIKNLTREELVQVLKKVDEHYLNQHNLRREQVDGRDSYDSFFPGRIIYASVSDGQRNQEIYRTNRRDLFHDSDLPSAPKYSVRMTAPGEEIWDTAGIWGGVPGKTYINNQETNAVRLMEFLADLLQGRN
jgi:hypothetical protein